jgi:hypothetical protein
MVSKEDFLAYEYSLKHNLPETYNLAMVMRAAGLTRDQWFEITKNYTELKNLYIRGEK